MTIVNDDTAVSFSAPTYSVNEDTGLGAAVIQLVRLGSTNNALSVDFLTTTNGTAVPGVNYTPVTNTVPFAPGQTTANVLVPVIHDPSPNGNRTVSMMLSNVVGGILLDPSQAMLTIIDIERAPGQFLFSTNSYTVGEGDTNAYVTILRTNGHTGVVSVHYATTNGSAFAVTWPGTVTWVNGNPPILKAAGKDIVVLETFDNGTTWLGSTSTSCGVSTGCSMPPPPISPAGTRLRLAIFMTRGIWALRSSRSSGR